MLTRLSNKCRADKIGPIRNQALAPHRRLGKESGRYQK